MNRGPGASHGLGASRFVIKRAARKGSRECLPGTGTCGPDGSPTTPRKSGARTCPPPSCRCDRPCERTGKGGGACSVIRQRSDDDFSPNVRPPMWLRRFPGAARPRYAASFAVSVSNSHRAGRHVCRFGSEELGSAASRCFMRRASQCCRNRARSSPPISAAGGWPRRVEESTLN